MKYQDIINRLNSLHLKSTKAIINAMEQLLPEFKYEKTGDAYCVFARYMFANGRNFALAFTIRGEKDWDGNLEFLIDSANDAEMLMPPKAGHYWQRVSPIVDTDQDLVRCKRQEAENEYLSNSPFYVDFFDHSKICGTRTLFDFRPLLFRRSCMKQELNNFQLPYQIGSMLDRIKSLADPYSEVYNPQLFWKELSEAYDKASELLKKEVERRQEDYRRAVLNVEEYLNHRKEVRIF